MKKLCYILRNDIHLVEGYEFDKFLARNFSVKIKRKGNFYGSLFDDTLQKKPKIMKLNEREISKNNIFFSRGL